MHLYELTEAFRKIQEVMYANAAPGESPHDVDEEDRFLEVANEAMDSYGLDIKGKIDSICAILTEMDAAITLREIESKRLKESARLMQAQADRLRAYLMSNMPTSKVKTALFGVTSKAAIKCCHGAHLAFTCCAVLVTYWFVERDTPRLPRTHWLLHTFDIGMRVVQLGFAGFSF